MWKGKKDCGAPRMYKSAMGHRRGDKYMFANNRKFYCISYRREWMFSYSLYDFETWLLIEKGVNVKK